MNESCEVVECIQGEPEWHLARSGCITASMFSVARERTGDLDDRQRTYVERVRAGDSSATAAAVAGYKKAPTSERVERAIAGERVWTFSAKAEDYAFRLAIERISGEPLDEGFETWQMRRGRELEDAARAAHELEHGFEVRPVGFVRTPDHRFGASADGFIEVRGGGGAEYKCFVAPEKLRPILLDRDPSVVMDQAQGGIWITGRSWWHVVLYAPFLAPCGRDLTVIPVERDDAYIEAMVADLWEFERRVQHYEDALRSDALPGVDDIAAGLEGAA